MVSENKFPVAKNPSLLEIHWVDELSEPSSASVAEAQNVILAPSSISVPTTGLFSVKVGGWFCVDSFIVICIAVESDIPSESVAVAVTV